MLSIYLPARVRPCFLLLLAWCCGIAGCSCSSSPQIVNKPLDPTKEKLLNIFIAYAQFCVDRQQPPQGPADLDPILAKMGKTDDPWRSPRDGQPFVVCWGVDLLKPLSWAKPNSTPVLAYEKQGVDGSRYVFTAVQRTMLMSDKEFHEATFPPGHNPGF
jgi:hypothetical protein